MSFYHLRYYYPGVLIVWPSHRCYTYISRRYDLLGKPAGEGFHRQGGVCLGHWQASSSWASCNSIGSQPLPFIFHKLPSL